MRCNTGRCRRQSELLYKRPCSRVIHHKEIASSVFVGWGNRDTERVEIVVERVISQFQTLRRLSLML